MHSITFVCHTMCFSFGINWHASIWHWQAVIFYESSSCVFLKFSLTNSACLCHRRFSIVYAHKIHSCLLQVFFEWFNYFYNSYSIFLSGKKLFMRIEMCAQEVSTKKSNKNCNKSDFSSLHAKWLKCFIFLPISYHFQCEFFLLS